MSPCLQEGAVNLVSALFNILTSASYNTDFRRKHLTKEDDRNKVGFYNLTLHSLKQIDV